MDNQLSCPLCDQIYQSDNLPRLLTGCGHTYCEKCLKNMMTEKKGLFKILCPEDGQMYSFDQGNISNFPKNLALIKIMDSKKNNLSFKDSSLEMSKIGKNGSIQDDEDARDLMDAIGSSTQNNQKQEEKPQVEMCQEHQKPLQVVCILDLKKICANCAIFGEHKGHEFKSLDQVEEQRMNYYTQILNIMDKKQNISERISNEETCTEIMGILTNKKQKIKKSVNNQYKKLYDAIHAKQKQSLKQLDCIIDKAEAKVKTLMKIEPLLMEKYMGWEQKSFEQIKILEGTNFQAKLELLFTDINNQSVDVIEQGQNIIADMNKQQENLFQEVETALQNIGVEFNNEIFNHIQGFADVYDEVKKRKPKTRISKDPAPSVSKSLPKKDHVSSKVNQQSNMKYEPSSFQKSQQNTKVEMDMNMDEDQEDLLDYDEPIIKKPQFIKKQEQQIKNKTHQEPRYEKKQVKIEHTPPVSQEIRQSKMSSSRKENSFTHERPNKKKLTKIKFTQKYEKIADALANDTLELVDFTNAELGDASILVISEFLYGSKAKTVKFIRNKINDETIAKILPYFGSVITLNLSQNFLTDRVLDILIDGRNHLSSMKNIILSQNKIIQRKHKAKIEKLRALDLIVSV